MQHSCFADAVVCAYSIYTYLTVRRTVVRFQCTLVHILAAHTFGIAFTTVSGVTFAAIKSVIVYTNIIYFYTSIFILFKIEFCFCKTLCFSGYFIFGDSICRKHSLVTHIVKIRKVQKYLFNCFQKCNTFRLFYTNYIYHCEN